MKRFLGFAFAMFFAVVGIALVGGDSGAVAGHGCHGRCHGGLFARLHRCHGEKPKCHGLFARHRKHDCHAEVECCVVECEPSHDGKVAPADPPPSETVPAQETEAAEPPPAPVPSEQSTEPPPPAAA